MDVVEEVGYYTFFFFLCAMVVMECVFGSDLGKRGKSG